MRRLTESLLAATKDRRVEWHLMAGDVCTVEIGAVRIEALVGPAGEALNVYDDAQRQVASIRASESPLLAELVTEAQRSAHHADELLDRLVDEIEAL